MTFLYSCQEFWAITHLSCFSWWFDVVVGSLGTTGIGSLRTAQFGSLRTVLESSSSSSSSSASSAASSSSSPPSSSPSSSSLLLLSCPLNPPHVPAPCPHLFPKPTPCLSPVYQKAPKRFHSTLLVLSQLRLIPPCSAPCPQVLPIPPCWSPKPTPCPSPMSQPRVPKCYPNGLIPPCWSPKPTPCPSPVPTCPLNPPHVPALCPQVLP